MKSFLGIKKTFLVWKDPACNGINPDWLQVSGQKFHAIASSTQGRFFEKLNSTEYNREDGIIYIEVTKERYIEGRKAKDRQRYLAKWKAKKGYAEISSDALGVNANGEMDVDIVENLLIDTSISIEDGFIKKEEIELLYTALPQLDEDEREIVIFMYLSGKKRSAEDYSKKTGMPRRTVNHKKAKTFEKIKKIMGY